MPSTSSWITDVATYPGDETTVVIYSEDFGVVTLHDVPSDDFLLLTSSPECAFDFVEYDDGSNEMVFHSGATPASNVVFHQLQQAAN